MISSQNYVRWLSFKKLATWQLMYMYSFLAVPSVNLPSALSVTDVYWHVPVMEQFKFSALFSPFVFRAAVVPLNSPVVRMFTRDPMLLLHRTMRPCTPRGRLTSDSASRLVVPEPVLLRRSPCSGQRVCGARAALDQGRACLSSRSRLALAVFSDERALFLAASCFLELSGLLRSTRCGCCSCAVWEGCTCSLEETASSSRSFYCVCLCLCLI